MFVNLQLFAVRCT